MASDQFKPEAKVAKIRAVAVADGELRLCIPMSYEAAEAIRRKLAGEEHALLALFTAAVMDNGKLEPNKVVQEVYCTSEALQKAFMAP